MSVVSLMLSMGPTGAPPPVSVTWNPSDKAPEISLSGNDLVATKTSGGDAALKSVRATQARSAADEDGWYFEVEVTSGSSSQFMQIGLATILMDLTGSMNNANGWCYYQEDGSKRHNGVNTAFGATWTTGDVIGVFLRDGKLWFSKNGSWQGGGDPDTDANAAFSGLSGNLYPCASLVRTSNPAHVLTARFATADFSYSPPSGGQAWDS